MRALLAITWREVTAKRFILLGALAASVMPMLAPWWLGFTAAEPAEARVTSAVWIAGLFELVVGCGLGATLLSAAPPVRGLGFDLSRPVPGLAVWMARVGTSTAIVLLSGLLVATPGVLIAQPGWWAIATEFWVLALVGVAAIPLGHLGELAFRSRSVLALVDVAVLVAVVLCWAWIYVATFFGAGAYLDLLFPPAFARGFDPSYLLGLVGASCVVLALLVASAAGVMQGRLDPGATRRRASITLWVGLLLGLVLPLGQLWWVLTPTPDDLTDVTRIKVPTRGSWVLVDGDARSRWNVSFAVDLASGRWERLPGGQWTVGMDTFSPSGSKAILVAPRSRSPWDWEGSFPDGDVFIGTFSERGADLELVSLDEEDGLFSWRRVFSPSESRYAELHLGGLVQVHDLSDGRRLCEVPFETGARNSHIRFTDDDHVRLSYPYWSADWRPGCSQCEPPQLVITEIDVPRCEVTPVATVEGLATLGHIETRVDATGGRIVLHSSEHPVVALLDGAGNPMAELLNEPNAEIKGTGFLHGGGIVLVYEIDDANRIAVFSALGTHGRTIDLPRGESVRIGCEFAPSHLLTSVATEANDWSESVLLAIDLERGDVRQIGTGMQPALTLQELTWGSPKRAPEPGAPATLLCLRSSEELGERSTSRRHSHHSPYPASLVRIDPETGEWERLLGP